jgi:hypothetical protein
MRRGKNIASWLDSALGMAESFFRGGKGKMKVVHKRPLSDEDFNSSKAARQKRIDDILDKISKGGYESLTKEEKDFLIRYSKD